MGLGRSASGNMRTAITIAALLTLLMSYHSLASDRICKGNPDIVASCFNIHGRLALHNGTPSVRIWRIGTQRILSVVHPENEIMPSRLRHWLSWDRTLYADFEVCPFAKERAGWMQDVCIESASNIVVEEYDKQTKTTKVYRLRND